MGESQLRWGLGGVTAEQGKSGSRALTESIIPLLASAQFQSLPCLSLILLLASCSAWPHLVAPTAASTALAEVLPSLAHPEAMLSIAQKAVAPLSPGLRWRGQGLNFPSSTWFCPDSNPHSFGGHLCPLSSSCTRQGQGEPRGSGQQAAFWPPDRGREATEWSC